MVINDVSVFRKLVNKHLILQRWRLNTENKNWCHSISRIDQHCESSILLLFKEFHLVINGLQTLQFSYSFQTDFQEPSQPHPRALGSTIARYANT